MTPSEMLAEIINETRVIFAVSDAKQKKVDKLIRKAAKYPYRVKSEHTSNRHNKWLLCWVANNKRAIGDDSLFYAGCLVDSPEGIYVMLPMSIKGHWYLMILSPHLFSRYAERMNIDKTGVDLRHHFLLRNGSYNLHTDNTNQHGEKVDSVVATCTDGMLLGCKTDNENVFVLRTFVSYDMLKEDQNPEIAKSERDRIGVHGY